MAPGRHNHVRGLLGCERILHDDTRVTVDFLDAVNGAKKRLELGPDRTLDVTVPAGVTDGQVLRLKGQGGPGMGGGPAGDALIEIRIAPHPLFRREGDDLHLVVPVSISEAALGAKIDVPSPDDGAARLRVPPGTQSGQRFRLRERGVPSPRGGRRQHGRGREEDKLRRF